MASMKETSRLVEEFREQVESHVRLLQIPTAREDVRQDCAMQLLSCIEQFLKHWDASTIKSTTDFPTVLVRNAFSTVLSQVGPGDGQVRSSLLETLSVLSSCNEAHQALLDVLPWTMPSTSVQELHEATQQVLTVLRNVLIQNAEMILPVLGCLSNLPLSQEGREEAWNVALAFLPVVREGDLPALIKTLLHHVSNDDNAARAIEALRTEVELVETSPPTTGSDEDGTNDASDPLLLIAHVLLGALENTDNGSILAKAYLNVLKSYSSSDDQDDGPSILVLDVVAIFALYQNPSFQVEMKQIMDDWLTVGKYPYSSLTGLLILLSKEASASSILYQRFMPLFLEIGIFLLFAPIRIGGDEVSLEITHTFIMELHHCMDRDYQQELIQCLLHLCEETSWRGVPYDDYYSKSRVGKKRSRSNTAFQQNAEKREGLSLTTKAVHALLQDLAQTAKASVARFKHHFIQRLTSVSTKINVHDNMESTRQLCSILGCLLDPVVGSCGEGIDASEVMILLQKLLFTSSYSSCNKIRHGDESTGDVGRVVRGMILATELIPLEALTNDDKECIFQWIHRILLPNNRRTVDPKIGCRGLVFLKAWSTCRHHQTHDGNISVIETNEDDIFSNVKMILANTGLIQMLARYLEGRNRPKDVVIGYTAIPAPFLIHSNPKRNKRDMVFCVTSFLRTSTVEHPSRWNDMVHWVYNLVDTYLAMGRTSTNAGGGATKGKSKWLPDGWLQAAIELPSLNLAIDKAGNKMKASVEWFSTELCSHEISLDALLPPMSVFGEVASALCDNMTIEETVDKVERLLRLVTSFLVGIGLSLAVLQNAYAHSLTLGVVNDNGKDEQAVSERSRELVKLMQYQLMKVYDLKRRVGTCIHFLVALEATVRKAYLRQGSKRRAEQVDDADVADDAADFESIHRKASKVLSTIALSIEQSKRVLSRIFDCHDLIDPIILLKCLLPTNDDTVIMEGLKLQSQTSIQEDFRMIVILRRHILDHLCAVGLEIPFLDGPIDDNMHACVSSVMKTASAISALLPTFRKGQVNARSEVGQAEGAEAMADNVSDLSASYLRYIKRILIKANGATNSIGPLIRRQGFADEEKKCDGDPALSSLMDLFLQCTVEMRTTQSNSEKQNHGRLSFVGAYDILLERLQTCEDEASALELLDILSVLSLDHLGLANRTIEACWRILFTVYAVPSREVEGSDGHHSRPCGFSEAATRILKRRKSAASKQNKHHLVERTLSETVLRTTTTSAQKVQKVAVLRSSILTMWGLMTQSSTSVDGFDYLSKLIGEIERFLDGTDGTESCDDDNNNIDNEERQNDSSKKRRRRSARRRRYVSPIPSLTVSSLDVFFELTLQVTVAALAVSQHARTSKGATDSTRNKDPFRHLQDFVQLFTRQLEVYDLHFQSFGRRMLSIVFGASNRMLNICLFHVHGCVKWRNAQPLLSVEEKRAGVHDFGSICFIDRLLQSFAVFCAGRVITLCQSILSQMLSRADNDEDTGEPKYVSGEKRVASLMASAQKTLTTLGTIAASHNLVPPTLEATPLRAPSKKDGTTLDDVDMGYHKLDQNETGYVDTDNGGPREESNKRRRLTPTFLSAQATGDEEEKGDGNAQDMISRRGQRPAVDDEEEFDWNEDDEQSSAGDESSSNAFGVSGQWGDDEDISEASSTTSLELEVSDLFQVA